MRKHIPITLGVIVAIIVFLQYFIVHPLLEISSSTIQLWAIILSSYALLMGLAAVTIYQIKQFMKTRYWYNALVLVFTYATLIIGLALSPASTEYRWIMSNINLPTMMVTASYLAFFISSAAYRAFRVKNFEAAILLFTAIVVMLKNMPLGNALIPFTLPLGNWLNDFFTLGANRGFTIAFGIGIILAGIKQLMGYQAYGE